MLTFDTVIQTQFGAYFKAFGLPTDEKPVTGVCSGSTIEEFNPTTGKVDIYRFNGSAWEKSVSDGTPAHSVPEVEEGDTGKVLTVGSDGPAWAVVPAELPEIGESDTGKVLTVGADGAAWAAVPAELPTIGESDTGKVLTVGADGAAWAALPEELPPLPEEAGTYLLQLVIAEGADPVLSWEDDGTT